MDKDFQRGLVEASQYHQSFIMMTENKGQFDAKQAAHCVERAESIYQALLNEDIDNPIVTYQLATLYMQTNRNGLAVQLLKPLCDRADAKLEWFNNLGAAYRNEHYNAEARDAFQKALGIQVHPDVLANPCAL